MDWSTVREALTWLAGPFLGALSVAWFNVRRQNAMAGSIVARHRVADSDLEYNKKDRRDAIADRDKTIEQLRGDLKHANNEIIDLQNQRYEIGTALARAEARHATLFRQHAKAAVKAVAALPAMSGVEVEEVLKETDFGDLVG